ncbi:MAG: ABC transporter permease [Treponema sp.]|nr:ABC transporter permease [Treponema sp.]
MKKSWTLFVASRYLFKGRGNSPVLSVLGIAFGVFALIVIISVMNGFQLGFIESILEISSYHLRVDSFPQEKTEELQEFIFTIPGVRAAVPFKEFQALARGRRTGQQGVLVRGLREDTLEIDSGMASHLDFEAGFFDISNPRSILLGSELARRLGVGLSDVITLFSITGILSAEDEGGVETFTVRGIFRSGYYEFDNSWAFINIDCVPLLDNESRLLLGIKINNRFNDRSTLERANRNMPEVFHEARISSWRDYNRAFFGALRTEKLFMFILVGLIFIVVGLNIFQAQRRAVLQRREEIGLLRAIGGTQRQVRFVFILDGAIVGLTGAGIGLVFGIWVASNIQSFFTAIENIVNFIIDIINVVAFHLGLGLSGQFTVFSPAVFYLREIPSRILPFEVVMIFLFGFLSAFAAAWFASARITKIQPAEVLRYE